MAKISRINLLEVDLAAMTVRANYAEKRLAHTLRQLAGTRGQVTKLKKRLAKYVLVRNDLAAAYRAEKQKNEAFMKKTRPGARK